MQKKIPGKIADLINEKFINGYLVVENGMIQSIVEEKEKEHTTLIIPGFIDAHVHIESSMLVPSQFGRMAVKHGTIATVSDPHEIANVVGSKGIDFMIDDGKKSPLDFYFGAPSCVPATGFETSGAQIDADQIEALMKRKDIHFLSEVMNYPGVIHEDKEITRKIEAALKNKKPIDGHAPGISGENLVKYSSKQITTDHECNSYEEALEKIHNGMKILIREGSAAKNFDALIPLANEYPEKIMFCSDDLHPDDLLKGHINLLVKRAVKKGIPFFKAIKIAAQNPTEHYNLNCGLLKTGDRADFIRINNLEELLVLETYIEGRKVFDSNEPLQEIKPIKPINKFLRTKEITADEIKVKSRRAKIRIIEAYDRELFTGELTDIPKAENDFVVSDPERDILKIVVLNRYENMPPAIGFIKNFGIKKGAIASSIAHDSHNIVAVGVKDSHIVKAINHIIQKKGGISATDGKTTKGLHLPVAGIMSDNKAEDVAKRYQQLTKMAGTLGCHFNAPFMTLSFMSLLVIPKLKIGDRGLFDVNKFSFSSLYIDT